MSHPPAKILVRAILAALFLVSGAAMSFADSSFSVVANFLPYPKGAYPASQLIVGPGGNFYGVTGAGGQYNDGTFFMLTPGGVLTTLASFNPAENGEDPTSLFLDTDGNFYGVTSLGGPGDYGAVFKATPTGTLTTLHAFSGSDGENPDRLIEGPDGYLYTSLNTTSSFSTGPPIIKISTTTGAITTINPGLGYDTGVEFQFLGTDGYLYGSVYAAGDTSDSASVVKVSTTGQVTTLYTFDSDEDLDLIQGPKNTVYGSTVEHGAYGDGSIFQVNQAGTLTTLVSFNPSSPTTVPLQIILGADGNFYGVAQGPGSNDPSVETVFEATPTGTVTTLATGPSFFGLVQTSNQDLYWATGRIGSYERLSNGAIKTVYNFSAPNLGTPTGPLIQGSDGNFYGTTSGDGRYGYGGVYKVTPSGDLSTVASFHDLTRPVGLTQAGNGNFYGINQFETEGTYGTIYEVTPAGKLSTLHAFSGASDGGLPDSALVKLGDGYLYGLTASGGAMNDGTFYKISPSGSFSVLASLDSSLVGENTYPSPVYQMALGRDGNFYVTTQQCIFKITPAGKPTILTTFSSGVFAPTAVVRGQDGNFYGTNPSGGSSGDGYLFKFTPKGKLTTLYSFGSIGEQSTAYPNSLALGTDGNYYVTTGLLGEEDNSGALVQITPSGTASLVPFSTMDNAPNSVIEGKDGTLYGTTPQGGAVGAGAIFNVNLDPMSGAVMGTAP